MRLFWGGQKMPEPWVLIEKIEGVPFKPAKVYFMAPTIGYVIGERLYLRRIIGRKADVVFTVREYDQCIVRLTNITTESAPLLTYLEVSLLLVLMNLISWWIIQ